MEIGGSCCHRVSDMYSRSIPITSSTCQLVWTRKDESHPSSEDGLGESGAPAGGGGGSMFTRWSDAE